jgi:hypothetical protein
MLERFQVASQHMIMIAAGPAPARPPAGPGNRDWRQPPQPAAATVTERLGADSEVLLLGLGT